MTAAMEDTPAEAGLMTGAAFRAWRKGLGLSQAEAAARLGLARRMIQYYELGDRGRPVPVPRTVRLACWALTRGIGDFDGETEYPAAATAEKD